ncbi:RNA polymerase sigma factor [Paracholeplasma brassicae]|uniref:RNA polymerase sigma factor n=1 Tax=Acholeplasma brassicae TaxID=61635 RepID=U4KSY3_9MOLU|nr:sigma-70 family RNA polymerase sigma factor [Paracholeplasma brassicae]CCV65739.1 RNA polymerase sigma factor [Paracholeplasma brassicae]
MNTKIEKLLKTYENQKLVPLEVILDLTDLDEGLYDQVKVILEEKGYQIDYQTDVEIEPIVEPKSTSVDPYYLYLKDMGEVSMLTIEQEKEVTKKVFEAHEAIGLGVLEDETKEKERQQVIEMGVEAKNLLIVSNLRLVVSIAKKYDGRLDLLDIIQEGNMGLMRAADKFDYRMGNRFSTYATWWIKQSISRAIAKQARSIRLPVHLVESLNKLQRTKNELRAELNQEPTAQELADRLDLTVEKVISLEQLSTDTVSLDLKVGSEEDATLSDFIASGVDDPEEQYFLEKEKEYLDTLLKTLGSRDEQVMRYRFGLYDGRFYTLEEIGYKMNLTRERIRQIISKSLVSLRKTGLLIDRIKEK